jgi:hypothetical protein
VGREVSLQLVPAVCGGDDDDGSHSDICTHNINHTHTHTHTHTDK